MTAAAIEAAQRLAQHVLDDTPADGHAAVYADLETVERALRSRLTLEQVQRLVFDALGRAIVGEVGGAGEMLTEQVRALGEDLVNQLWVLDAPADVFDEMRTERRRQIAKGYTPEHDDTHTPWELVELAQWTPDLLIHRTPELLRPALVKSAALMGAAVERVDRLTRS